jgi:hypothetical protein
MKKISILLLTVLLMFGCDFDSNKLERINVKGEIVTTTDMVEDFNELIIAGPFDVVFEQDGGNQIQIETYESVMEWVRVEMLEDGTLLLYLEDTSGTHTFDITFDDHDLDKLSRHAILSGSRLKWPENKKNLKVVLSIDDLKKVQVLGESEIKLAQTLKTDDFDFEVAGAVHLIGDFEVHNFKADLAGAGSLDLSGSARYLEINCAGAGTIRAYDLIADSVDLEIAGVCNAQVYAKDKLNVEIAGMGTVKYKGAPDISIDKAGIGSVKQVETNQTDI